jgi:hypothetical protein
MDTAPNAQHMFFANRRFFTFIPIVYIPAKKRRRLCGGTTLSVMWAGAYSVTGELARAIYIPLGNRVGGIHETGIY